MEITEQEKKLAYSLLSDVNKSTNKEREFELKGILKGILLNKYDKNSICNMNFDFSHGQIKFLKQGSRSI